MIETMKQTLLARRPDLRVILDMIPAGARILDLGCGDGALLRILRDEKGVRGCGVEVEQRRIIESVANGVPVVHGDLNDGLRDFRGNSFDFVVLSQTLQALRHPDLLIDEMLRVGRNAIISFINFGHVGVRFQLLVKGRMPISRTLPDAWHKTENIHLATIRDFRVLCQEKGVRIVKEAPLGENGRILLPIMANWFALTCVFVISKD